MGIIATTITEYYELIGEKRGEKRGTMLELGRWIESLQRMYQEGTLAEPAYLTELSKAQDRLAKLKADSQDLAEL